MNEFRANEPSICVENSRQIPHETNHYAKIESPQRLDRQLRSGPPFMARNIRELSNKRMKILTIKSYSLSRLLIKIESKQTRRPSENQRFDSDKKRGPERPHCNLIFGGGGEI